ncbi:Holliday junction recognition protein isoform X2 [Sagmatias obliquidens]|uniref:Holliday junction recognition protein isoform X2 n=1 Tax=Sagmatias obliquidens TaxID=3371155 RepID=UPI000F441979|nr:Holliday junction recognition protein isoform X2 [Lagenorhynchus obliquidens]
MEGEVLGEDALLQKLRDSRRRFQRRMQQLIEKYNQPFEDAPVVQMSTLTYETPQGLRIWGGRLIKERNTGQIQGSPVKTDDRTDGSTRVPAGGHELPLPCTQVEDSVSSDTDTTLFQEDVVAGNLMGASYGEGKDTRTTLVPSLASPARPAQGYYGGNSEESPGGPFQPTSLPREGDALHSSSADLALVPRGDGISLQGGTGGSSFSSGACSEAEDICNATLSDLYAGMLHSMSCLLGVRPSCVISTKTFIRQNWSSKRRHRCKSRMDRTSCRGGGRSRRSPRERRPPGSESAKDVAVLRDRENILDVSGHKMGLKLGRAFLEINQPQIHAFASHWKELPRTPQKHHSSLTYLDSNAVYHLDQENRFMALNWLISPVKIGSRPRVPPGEGGNRYREIEIRFDKLHQEYCSTLRKQPCLTYLPGSSSVDVYRGGPASPGSPQGIEAHRPSSPLRRAKAKRLSEAFESLGKGSIREGSCPPKSDSFPSLSKTNSTCSLGRSEQTSDLACQGNDLGGFRKSVSLNKAISVPRVQPPGCARDRYDDIKEKFDKLHQKYCQKSLQQTQVPSGTRASPDKASVGVRYPKEDFSGKFHPDSGSQRPPSLSSSPQQSIKSPLGSNTIRAPPPTGFALDASWGHQVPTKRRRLSDPQVCRRWTGPWDFSPVGRAIPRPGEEAGSV